MKYFRFLIALALLGFVPAHAAPVTPASGDITTEEGLRAELDRLETRYEAACIKLGETIWEARGPGPATAPAKAARDEAYNELALIHTDPKLTEILAYWMKRNTVTRDPSLTRRVILWNKTRGVAAITLDLKLRAMEDGLSDRIKSGRPLLDGRSTTHAELQAIVASNPDTAMRRKAWLALAGPPVTSLKTDVWNLIRLRAVQAQPIKEHWFHDLIYHAQDLEPYWTFNMMEVLMKRTEPAWRKLLVSFQKTLNKEKLQPWDYDHALLKLAEARGVTKILQTRFKPENADPAARALLSGMGFDLSKIPLRLEVAPFTFPALFVPVRIPSDLRVLLNPPAGPADVLPFYEQVFRAYGHAAQTAFNRQESSMMKGYPWIPGALNAVYAEGMAAGFSEFLRDPLFLSRQMGLTAAEIDIFLKQERDRRLLEMRRRLLSMAIEFTVYVNPAADLDARYRELAVKALGVDMSATEASVWRTDPMLVSRPVHHQDLMLAESIGRDLHARLADLFGEDRLGSGKTAAWLIERCFSPGENLPLQERLYKSIDGGFDFDALVESLGPPADAPAVN